MQPTIRLHKDTWLSGILHREAFRATLDASAPLANYDEEFSGLAPNSFVYAKVGTSDLSALRALEKYGLHIVETTLTFERQIQPANVSGQRQISVRAATANDRHTIMRIAGAAFVNSRFHQDPNLVEYASTLKAEWAGNFFEGVRGDKMLVADVDGAVVGFLQLLTVNKDTLVIDLIAVDTKARGMGVASALIESLNELKEYSTVRVGTQSHNIPSVNLYEKLGFRLSNASYALHYHHATVSQI